MMDDAFVRTMICKRHRHPCSTMTAALFLPFLIIFASHAFAFQSQYATKPAPQVVHNSWLFSADSDDWNVPADEEDLNIKPERSQIPDYIAAYLRRESTSQGFSPTHMVGIPMDSCHELLIELESVQRAILYHCPVLVHSCIVASMTRLPLLYVDASFQPSGRVTRELQELTERIVKTHCYTERAESDETDLSGAGADGYLPLTLNFHKLEIDGEKHDVLHTKAVEGEEGTMKLIAMVQELKDAIQSKGWTVQYPSNPHQTDFVPRIPFMRIPKDFSRHLEDIPENDFHTAEQGGNGISPIFWCKWWDDYMGRSIRLREVGIYPKRPGYDDMDESTFYLPHETIALPNANERLSKIEQKHAKYNEERMAKAEKFLDQDDADAKDTMVDQSLEANRKLLESLYGADNILTDGLVVVGEEPFVNSNQQDKTKLKQSPVDDDRLKQEIEGEHVVVNTGPVDVEEGKDDKPLPISSVSTESPSRKPLSDWMEDRIRKIVESRGSALQREQVGIKRENLPSIEDNPVLNAFKAGTLVSKSAQTSTEANAIIELPPYPSRQWFIGFWRIVQSPTGIDEDTGDETQTDNLVLRADGTTSGGPILNQEYRQRAAGGTWKFIEEANGSVLLRIRLVMPPKKERILVMEGSVTRGSNIIDSSASLLSSTVFGITRDSTDDQSLQCRGDVWLEDAVTKTNRKGIGTFFIEKLETSKNPRDYTITIPKPTRNQD